MVVSPPYDLPNYEAVLAQNRQESVLARSIRDDRKSGASAQRIMRGAAGQVIRRKFSWWLLFKKKSLTGQGEIHGQVYRGI